jgi:adenylosuccinate synthase
MFDSKTRTIVVVGAQWGDEGMGKLVDVLAERADWVVRYQGGANAGHTVHIGDRSTVLHQIPSGILHSGVRCAIGNGVVLDPETLFTEVDELVRDGVDVEGRLYVSDRAHLVLAYHKLVDKESAASKAIGTTGRGIGPAYEDKVARRGVRVLDLRHPKRLRALVERGTAHANQLLSGFGSPKRAEAEYTLGVLESLSARLLAIADDVGLAVHRAIRSGASVLLEGAQGSLLDVDHGTYPFVTSSSTTAGGASIGVGIGPRTIDEAIGVVKAYTTRVGAGPLPTEFDEAMGEHVRRLGNEFGATPGVRAVAAGSTPSWSVTPYGSTGSRRLRSRSSTSSTRSTGSRSARGMSSTATSWRNSPATSRSSRASSPDSSGSTGGSGPRRMRARSKTCRPGRAPISTGSRRWWNVRSNSSRWARDVIRSSGFEMPDAGRRQTEDRRTRADR